MFRPFPLGSVSLLGATKVVPPRLPLSRLHSLPLPIQQRKRRRPLLLRPTQHSTHLRTSPRMERRRTHPPQPFFFPRGKLLFPRKLLLPLLNGLRSRKRAAEAEEKEERMVVVYIYFNRGSSPSAFVSCSTVPFPPLPITIFLAAPKSTFPFLSLPLFLGGREREMYPSPSPTQP